MVTAADTVSGQPPAMADRREGDWFGHPRGLTFIVLTETWERFSFYGMQALLILYMTGRLLHAGVVEAVWGMGRLRTAIEAVVGPLSQQALAAQIFGLYVALVYLGPIIGGAVGDRLLGRTPAVLFGALLLAGGHFLMAYEPAFLVALSCIIAGAGLLKGNLAAQVGALYPRGDPRHDEGYTLYITSVVVGAFIAPLVCGTLGEVYGWHYGFGAAGVGMLIGIAVYLSGLRYLRANAVSTGEHEEPARLAPGDGMRIVALCVLILITSLFWTVQSQIWNTYPIWVRDHVSLAVGGGLSIPVTWFQSLDALAVLLLTPVSIALWTRLRRRGAEPDDIVKIAFGCALFGLGCVLLTLGQWQSGAARVGILWPILFHFVIGAGYLLGSPVALAVVARAAPLPVRSTMVGGYYIGIFIAGIASGWLGRFYEPLHPPAFWLLHAAVGLSGAVILLLLRGWFKSVLGGLAG
jgi:POT family proton-dependent oligopeptide transporter